MAKNATNATTATATYKEWVAETETRHKVCISVKETEDFLRKEGWHPAKDGKWKKGFKSLIHDGRPYGRSPYATPRWDEKEGCAQSVVLVHAWGNGHPFYVEGLTPEWMERMKKRWEDRFIPRGETVVPAPEPIVRIADDVDDGAEAYEPDGWASCAKAHPFCFASEALRRLEALAAAVAREQERLTALTCGGEAE